MDIVAGVLILVFLSLSGIHIYWAFGGMAGCSCAIPEVNGKPLFQPGKIVTMVVALGLAALAFLCALLQWPNIIALQHFPFTIYAGGISSFLFAARSIGDFKYAGFFKRIKNTGFSRLDTVFYSPLCLVVSILLGVLAYRA